MNTKRWLFVLIMLSLVPILDLWKTGLPITHDGPDHVARIANFYQSLSEGNLVPRWAGNLNWGYGHPILMFLYPLPSYVASLFHAVGFSFVDSTKLVFGVAYIASLLAMYLFASTPWGALPGLFAAVLYGFAPYRFVDLYVRGAIGEHVAFIFPPLIFYGLLRVARNNRETLGGVITALGMAGLLLSHNAIALMMLPLIAGYIIYLYIFESKRSLSYLLLTTFYLLLGFALSAFFWVPAFFEGKYTLRDIVTKGDFSARFVPWQWFFVSPWNYGGGNEFTKEIGILQWLSIISAFIIFFRIKSRGVKWFIGGSLVSIVLSLWLMTDSAGFVWEKFTLLQKFQFPWRFLTISVLLSSLLGGFVVSHIPKKITVPVIVGFVGLIFLSTWGMWSAKEYMVRNDDFYSGIYEGTTDTGESSPIWSIRFMEHQPKAVYEAIEGEAMIVLGFRNSTRHEFTVSAKTDARIVDNTLYFPGWSVLVDDQKIPVEFQDPTYRGLMTFLVSKGEHRIVVDFGETKLRKMANVLSLGGLIIFIFYETFRRYRHI